MKRLFLVFSLLTVVFSLSALQVQPVSNTDFVSQMVKHFRLDTERKLDILKKDAIMRHLLRDNPYSMTLIEKKKNMILLLQKQKNATLRKNPLDFQNKPNEENAHKKKEMNKVAAIAPCENQWGNEGPNDSAYNGTPQGKAGTSLNYLTVLGMVKAQAKHDMMRENLMGQVAGAGGGRWNYGEGEDFRAFSEMPAGTHGKSQTDKIREEKEKQMRREQLRDGLIDKIANTFDDETNPPNAGGSYGTTSSESGSGREWYPMPNQDNREFFNKDQELLRNNVKNPVLTPDDPSEYY